MKGYKVFNPDWTCKDFQYKVGQTYELEGDPVCCEYGFHFCIDLKDCFNYYDFSPNNKVAVIEACGAIVANDNKCCTNRITIVEEITWENVLRLVNTGKSCSGLGNSGNYNSGSCNSGSCNSGNYNSGHYNSGSCNSGNYNSGHHNSGHYNSGNYNSGNCNSGNCNSGHHNSGHHNSGHHNSGHYNSGNYNSGNYNSGSCNSGNCNSGSCNSGSWNKTYFSSGVFNTKEEKILMFNKPSNWTYKDWLDSKACLLLNEIKYYLFKWVYSNDMTDKEKEEHPEHETTGGYLKKLKSAQKRWDTLSNNDRKIITSLPNFDAKIFEEITGIKINESEEAKK